MRYRSVPIGVAFHILNGATPSSANADYWNGDIPWICPADLGKLSSRYIERGGRNITKEGLQNSGTQLVPIGTIILSTRAPIGHIAISTQSLCFNQGCRGLVPRKGTDSEYAYWALTAIKDNLIAAGQGTTFVELSRDALRAEKIPLPDLATQRRIADFLDRETARIDRAIACIAGRGADKNAPGGTLLYLLAEKRAALITAAVTGQIDIEEHARSGATERGLDAIEQEAGA